MNILQRESVEPRLDSIEKEVILLQTFAKLPLNEFHTDVVIDRTLLHLRYALEGIFHIGSHILSRTPGGRFTEYKEIARKLGELGIVDATYADESLIKMAGYRNRLTHFYAQITPEELYNILKTHLTDITRFVEAIKQLLKNPKKLGYELNA